MLFIWSENHSHRFLPDLSYLLSPQVIHIFSFSTQAGGSLIHSSAEFNLHIVLRPPQQQRAASYIIRRRGALLLYSIYVFTWMSLVWFSSNTSWWYGAMATPLRLTDRKWLCIFSRSSNSTPVHSSSHAGVKNNHTSPPITHNMWTCVCRCVCVTYTHTLLPAGRASGHTGHMTDLGPRPCTHTVHSARHTAAAAIPTRCSCTVNTPLLAMTGYHSNQQNTCRMTADSQCDVTAAAVRLTPTRARVRVRS